MRTALKSTAWRVAPGRMADRAARYERGLRAQWGVHELARDFIARHGDRVLHGPLRGMRYRAAGDVAVAKLLGVYEEEIAPWIAAAIAGRPAAFVDLGAADGYWAVGVARACGAPVHAFELSQVARDELAETAALNGVSLDVRKQATAASVGALPLDGAVVLCDIEGAEGDVLSPGLIQRLGTATVIVEVHDHLVPGVGALLNDRFAPTHACEVVASRPRDPSRHPELAEMSPGDRALALDEHRDATTTFARFVPR